MSQTTLALGPLGNQDVLRVFEREMQTLVHASF